MTADDGGARDARQDERRVSPPVNGQPAGGQSSAGRSTAARSGAPPGGARGQASAAAFAGVGFQFAAALVAFYYLGQWLDRRLGTGPVFLLGCVLVGSGAAFYTMYRQLMGAQRRAEAARAAAREGAGARDARP